MNRHPIRSILIGSITVAIVLWVFTAPPGIKATSIISGQETVLILDVPAITSMAQYEIAARYVHIALRTNNPTIWILSSADPTSHRALRAEQGNAKAIATDDLIRKTGWTGEVQIAKPSLILDVPAPLPTPT